MDGSRFDALARFLATRLSRRGAAPLTASLLAAPLLAATTAEAKKKNKKKKKLKKKKKKCLKNQENRWCKNRCLNVTSDPNNCGACDNACSEDETCCNGSCVDVAADPDHCGTCNNACGANAICDDGECHTCTVTCDGNAAACGTSLQTALDAGGTVYVCPGRYVGNFLIDTANVTVVGSGEGDDPVSNTILDANQSDRVLEIATGFTATLRRLRITGGNDDGVAGAIRNIGTLTMTSCVVADNTTAGPGTGGISQNQMATGPVTLTNCTISGNTGNGNGGGINQASSTQAVTLNNCTISSNEAGLDGEGSGGGINVNQGTVNVNGGRITGNTAATDGGGIFNSEFGTVNIDGTEVSGNSPNQCTNVTGC